MPTQLLLTEQDKQSQDKQFAETVSRIQAKEFAENFALSDEVIKMPNKLASDHYARVEQNMIELPICVANKKEIRKEHIEFDLDANTKWKLTRPLDGVHASPEFYPYFLWFLDKIRDAHYDKGMTKIPRINIDYAQILREVDQGKYIGTEKMLQAGGSYYKKINKIFRTFARLEIQVFGAWHDKNGLKDKIYRTLGSGKRLIEFDQWSVESSNGKVLQEGAYIAPGPLLWKSIQDRYIMQIPLSAITQMPGSDTQRYLQQRMYVLVKKHLYNPDLNCEKVFQISLRKLLAKIPLSPNTTPGKAKITLRTAHDFLANTGLTDGHPRWEGRGENVQLLYYPAAA